MKQYRVAILGATGAVGQEFLRLFTRRQFPVSAVRLLASERSSGKLLKFKTHNVPVQAVSADAFDAVDIAFFSAGSEAARHWAPIALQKGAVVIDNSSAFRMDEGVPLVVPEINWHVVRPSHRLFPVGNCTAIILMMAVAPLRKFGRISRIVASSYQSVSGAGARAMQELERQTRELADSKPLTPQVFPFPIAGNLFSHNTPINEFGYNQEEWKVIQETRKTLESPGLAVEITCVRVPVLRAHSLSINVQFDGPAPAVGAMREAYEAFPGVKLVDDRENNTFPMPIQAAGEEDVLVGRIRRDATNPNCVSVFACGDQLLKGAALNALQIAEKLAAQQLIAEPLTSQ
jgi:aspartate-semialdehyde dehydrogenase